MLGSALSAARSCPRCAFRRLPRVAAVAIETDIAARGGRTAEADLVPGLGMRIVERRHVGENPALEESLGVEAPTSDPRSLSPLCIARNSASCSRSERTAKPRPSCRAFASPSMRGKPLPPSVAHVGHIRLAETVPMIGEQLGVEQGNQRHRIALRLACGRMRRHKASAIAHSSGAEETRHIRCRQTFARRPPSSSRSTTECRAWREHHSPDSGAAQSSRVLLEQRQGGETRERQAGERGGRGQRGPAKAFCRQLRHPPMPRDTP